MKYLSEPNMSNFLACITGSQLAATQSSVTRSLSTTVKLEWVICVAYLQVFWSDILQAIAELNWDSHCITANSEYFEVPAVSIGMMLWASDRT